MPLQQSPFVPKRPDWYYQPPAPTVAPPPAPELPPWEPDPQIPYGDDMLDPGAPNGGPSYTPDYAPQNENPYEYNGLPYLPSVPTDPYKDPNTPSGPISYPESGNMTPINSQFAPMNAPQFDPSQYIPSDGSWGNGAPPPGWAPPGPNTPGYLPPPQQGPNPAYQYENAKAAPGAWVPPQQGPGDGNNPGGVGQLPPPPQFQMQDLTGQNGPAGGYYGPNHPSQTPPTKQAPIDIGTPQSPIRSDAWAKSPWGVGEIRGGLYQDGSSAAANGNSAYNYSGQGPVEPAAQTNTWQTPQAPPPGQPQTASTPGGNNVSALSLASVTAPKYGGYSSAVQQPAQEAAGNATPKAAEGFGGDTNSPTNKPSPGAWGPPPQMDNDPTTNKPKPGGWGING